jgi:hypothetical protein
MYTVFTRNWWKENPSYPDGLEPDGSAKKTKLKTADSEEEARAICREYNENNQETRLGRRAEYMGGGL